MTAFPELIAARKRGDHATTFEVTLLADVRTLPRSRANPQYNEDDLPQALQPFGIAYAHMTDLGFDFGLRHKRHSHRCSVRLRR